MVMPKIPFSLFNMENILFFGTKFKILNAAAGVAISAQSIYMVEPGTFALIIGASVKSAKTTNTEAALYVYRSGKGAISGVYGWTYLLKEDHGGNAVINWPSNKASASHSSSHHLCFMFPGDELRYSHALTAAETIVDQIAFQVIIYKDVRYPEK